MSELNSIALKILSNGKGILAADESTATMTKRLDSVGISSTPENRLSFRETLFSSSSMSDLQISSGVISCSSGDVFAVQTKAGDNYGQIGNVYTYVSLTATVTGTTAQGDKDRKAMTVLYQDQQAHKAVQVPQEPKARKVKQVQ